ncbi:DNA polymerase III subunit alpha [Chitinophaga horti]|uniref:DNA-directed DNA polymerase n=1 Tax=Chitinophaga horti TaxID=2920382 RepID=A0ABY6J0K3_9BACT|nr:DNA polymerase III subunit alpha [Chitinophaga horti]UYQ91844.1 DNA polymerase III subunit alpha [Chitinophaga horti]
MRYGTIRDKELVSLAKEWGVTSLALTNINSTTGAWDFVRACRAADIKPVIGMECRNGGTFCYLLLAREMEGWLSINDFLSAHLHSGAPFPAKPGYMPGVYVVYPWGAQHPASLAEHELIGVRPRELSRLFRMDVQALRDKLVMLQPVTFATTEQYELHRLLRAVDCNLLITQLPQQEVAASDELFVPPHRMLEWYAAYPSIVQNTLRIMDSCDVQFDLKASRNKQTFTGSRQSDKELLREKAMEGLGWRYGADHEEARQRVEKELHIIDKMDFNAYFLITWDIICYARNRGFFFVGRGSGANSVVAYCLGITNVDPVALGLYFERFLNPHRASPPDFDIDFSWRDRDDIFRYIFKKYGEKHAALLGTVNTFQTNAVVRELGKVFGLPKYEIDRVLEKPYEVSLGTDNVHRRILHYGQMLEAYPNHLSIHAGGVLISEAPIHQHCATHMPPKGFSTAQLDMHMAESIHLHKFDILSQRGLGHIRDTISLVKQNRGVDVDIDDVKGFMEDEHVKQNLRQVNTIGCFYIESPGMRQLLQKLRCENYITLVAASSIIRPGVAQAGMMRQYVHNFHHPDKTEYLHPVMKELLAETYGVMVYQEDVIRVAHRFADLELADADTLRRAMSGKYRGEESFRKIQQQFFENCDRLGRERSVSEEVWRQISSFANFSFSKAHSASFAVESYQSLFLKTYFPAEFMVAVINNFGGFYNRELYFRELSKAGVTLHPPCVNDGDYYTNIKGSDVYTGFIQVDRLEQAWMERVLRCRQADGLFSGLEDFIARTAPAPEQLEILIRVGAFKFTGESKKSLLWQSSLLLRKQVAEDARLSLFREEPRDWKLPHLSKHTHEDAFDEIELLGFPLASPFEVLDHQQDVYDTAGMIDRKVGQQVKVLGYLVTLKYIRTSKGDPMCFGTFLDREMNFVDTVHFPQSLGRYPFQKGGFYVLEGLVTEEFGVITINVQAMKKIGYFEDRVFEGPSAQRHVAERLL